MGWSCRNGRIFLLESPGNPYDGIDNDGDYQKSGFSAPLFTEEDFDSVK